MRIYIPSPRQLWLNLAMFFLVGVLVSRGVLEKGLPKSVAMVSQLGVVCVVLAALFILYIRYFSLRHHSLLVSSAAFLLVMGMSCLLTTLFQDFYLWGIYVVFNLYLVVVAVGVIRLQDSDVSPVAFHRIIGFWGWSLFLVATLEQLKVLGMPGYSFLGPLIRPASLTGSFLHYPILMALFAYITLQWYQLSKDKFYLLSGIVFALAPIVVISRSGAFIVLFTVCIGWLVSLVKGEKRAIWLSLLLCAGVVALLLSQAGKSDSFIERLLTRIAMAGNLESAGNSGRVHSWIEAIRMWCSTNLIFGEFTGAITNSTKNLFPGKSDVAESGVLQQLVNFGLLGLVLFYALLLHVYTHIGSHHRLLRHVYLAALTQTLFYQSIEVVPFITLLLFLPWVSNSYDQMAILPVKA